MFRDELLLEPEQVEAWLTRFHDTRRVAWVNLAKRPPLSRDPDDNMVLATALAGNADIVVTNDRDLLDIPVRTQDRLGYLILTPSSFVRWFEEEEA